MRRLAITLLLFAPLTACQSILGIDDPAGKECTLLDDSSCGDMQTCDYDEELGRTACRPVGTLLAGEACNAQDDCLDHASCADGMCRLLCSTKNDCASLGSIADCTWSKGTAYVCSDGCDVTKTETCQAGFECEIEYNYAGVLSSNCLPIGWFGRAQLGEDCSDIGECTEGLGCWDADGDGYGQCTHLCNVGGTACDNGQTCHSIGMLDGVEIGLCIAP